MLLEMYLSCQSIFGSDLMKSESFQSVMNADRDCSLSRSKQHLDLGTQQCKVTCFNIIMLSVSGPFLASFPSIFIRNGKFPTRFFWTSSQLWFFKKLLLQSGSYNSLLPVSERNSILQKDLIWNLSKHTSLPQVSYLYSNVIIIHNSSEIAFQLFT